MRQHEVESVAVKLPLRSRIMTKKTDTRSASIEVLERAIQAFGPQQVAEERSAVQTGHYASMRTRVLPHFHGRL
jgi:hypothetical protein